MLKKRSLPFPKKNVFDWFGNLGRRMQQWDKVCDGISQVCRVFLICVSGINRPLSSCSVISVGSFSGIKSKSFILIKYGSDLIFGYCL